MQMKEDLEVIPIIDKQKRKKKKEKIVTAESTEKTQIEGRKKKNSSDEVTRDINEKEADIVSMSDEKKKNKKKKKEKREKKKKREKDEGEKDKSMTSSQQGPLETAGDQKKDKKAKKKKEKGRKMESLTTEANVEGRISAKDDRSSGDSSKKRKGSISDAGETNTKKRKHNELEKGSSNKSKPLKKANKVANDKVSSNACDTSSNRSACKPNTSQSNKKSKLKSVSFSGEDEVFPFTEDYMDRRYEEYDESQLVRGKRFSKEEDQQIRDAVENYIMRNQLGENGLQMVLKCRTHPNVRGCWKEIGAALPWRPSLSVYKRAHILYEMSEKRGFSEEEMEVIRKFHAESGPQWKQLAEVLGKHRIHIKDAWRRIRLANEKKGHWSQDEYQTLFNLVNLDLRIKAFKERKSENVMIRENISWEAISDKISTRSMSSCCHKWYDQLRSPLVARGVWADSDDYRLLDALQKQDACNVEDVDWDNLLDQRSGDVCRIRWDEMVRHIGEHRERTFIERVDVLTKRYCADMPQYRFKDQEGEVNEDEEKA